MHLCFVDESGTPPKATAERPKPYFILAGVIIPEGQWHGISQELSTLKADLRFRVRGEIKWRFFGAANDDPVNTVRHLSAERRDEFRHEMFGILTKRKSIKIVSCVACVAACYETHYINNGEQLYNYTYKPVSERFQYFLQDLSRAAGDTRLGIIVADHRGRKQDEEFRRHHHRLIQAQSPVTSEYANIIETIFLTPSQLSVGIQFADMVAGAIGRKFNSGDDRWFEAIRAAFRSNNRGIIDGYGLVKMPKATFR